LIIAVEHGTKIIKARIGHEQVMSPIVRAFFVSILLLAVSGANLADANSTGVSGKTTTGCTCHATDAMIIPTISG
jgi:Trk-type K+ transport system membrane component